MKNLIAPLFDHNIDVQERTFRLMGIFGLAALLVMSLLSILMRESLLDVMLIYGGLMVFLVIFLVTIRTHRIQTGATVIACLLILVMLPGVFFSSGGMYGGTPMWFLFTAVYVSMVLRRRRRIVFISMTGVVLVACYLIQWYFPQWVIPHTARMAYIDSLASTLIVGLFVTLMIIFETDIYVTEQHLAEERRNQIEEINRAQNRFFSNMSHEIRTPVNTILGLNEMIMREAMTVEVAEDARSIQGAGQMLLALINDILDMSKIESGRMELVSTTYSVEGLLSEIVNMFWSPTKEKGLEFHIDVDETCPKSLMGDDIRIKQILVNLLNNAVKYTNEGSVTLSVECRRHAGDLTADMIYSVTDTGTGIKQESLPMLFDVFRRIDEGKNRYIEGTGLGLSIVKQLVDLMGGEITVDSVYMKGSTFRVRLPQRITNNENLGRVNLRSGHTVQTSSGYRQIFEAPTASVLIVDDNELNAGVAAKLLSATKMTIDTALSGIECLALTQKKSYNVILMDHLMPDMDGIETLNRIRSQKGGMNRETPIIALTANAGSENQALYRRSGFDGYLLKPVSGTQLEEAVMAKLPPQVVTRTGISTVNAGDEHVVDTHVRKENMLITVDSICDLPDQILGQHHIEILPYRIRTPEGFFVDRSEINTGEVIGYLMQNKGKTIDAKAPTTEEYQSFFAERLVRADHVFHLTTSAGGEEAYHNASEAAESFGNVTVFDTGQLSGGIGMLAIMAARIVERENPTPAGLAGALNNMKTRVRVAMVADSTDRLVASGRFSPRLSGLLQSFLLRPCLVPAPGRVRIKSLITGPRQQYLSQFVRTSLTGNIDRSRLFVLSPNLAPLDRDRLENLIRRRVPFDEIRFMQTGAATSLVLGSEAVVFVYLIKS